MTIAETMVLAIEVASDAIRFRGFARETALPVGVTAIARDVSSDPPRPEELVNAIGIVSDHIDDVRRALPELTDAGLTVTISGIEVVAIAAVEVGANASLPFELSRHAAEDVFRTLATETRAERARNPGLDHALVDTVVAGCCIVVAIIRSLQLDHVMVVEPETR